MIRIKIKSVNYFEIHNINRYMLYVDFIFINFFFNFINFLFHLIKD